MQFIDQVSIQLKVSSDVSSDIIHPIGCKSFILEKVYDILKEKACSTWLKVFLMRCSLIAMVSVTVGLIKKKQLHHALAVNIYILRTLN